MKTILLNDMKKTYVSPLASEVFVKTEAIMDGSIGKYDNDENANTQNPGAQMGNTNRGEWGNLWSK